MSVGHVLVSSPVRPRAVVGLSAVVMCALTLSARGQDEPGQTPRPKAEPVHQPTEEELARLPKDHQYFHSVKNDAPFLNRGKLIADPKLGYAAEMELRAYDYTLAFARRQPVERLRRYSVKDVPAENLFRPIGQDYLRELLHFEGTLRLVLQMKPTDDLRELEGVEHLYEAWVALRGSDKFACVVVTELPPGIKPGENQTAKVAFDAYFFKVWHYESRRVKDAQKDPDRRQWERAALFLGRTFDVTGTEEPPQTYSPTMLIGVVSGLAAIGLAALLLGLWFRRGDRRIQSGARDRLHQTVSFDNIPDQPGPANRIIDQN